MMWLIVLALGGELTEPVAVDKPVTVEGVVYTSAEPIYLLPTPTFDRMLADTKKLQLCSEGLGEVRTKLTQAEIERNRSQHLTFTAMEKAGAALELASAQMERDGEQDAKNVEQLLEMQRKLGRAQSQRNVALGVATGLAAGLVAYGLTSR